MKTHLDVVIIGAGTAGLSALKEVAKVTSNYVVIQDGPFGTTCARVGCMPSKVLIQIANDYHRRTHFSERGIRGGNHLSLDGVTALRFLRGQRDHFVKGVLSSLDRKDSRVRRGRAKIEEPGWVSVGKTRLHAKRIIVATGSTPIVPAEWPELGDRLLTTDTLFELTRLPGRIAVVGLGAIGVEMGQALSRLGCRVMAFTRSGSLAGLTDPRVNASALKAIADDLPIKLNTEVTVERTKGGVRVNGIAFDAVLACLGRRPAINDVGLENLGVPLDDRGMPEIDPFSAQVKGAAVFVAGDADGQRAVLHEAADEGFIAGYNSVRAKAKFFPRRCPLAITFCEPNVALVGTRFAAQKHFVTGEVDFADQGRAKILGENHGRLHLYADKKTGRLTGAELAAPRGEHLAHLLAWCIQRKLTVADLLALPFYHPVVEEGLRTALRHAAKRLSAK